MRESSPKGQAGSIINSSLLISKEPITQRNNPTFLWLVPPSTRHLGIANVPDPLNNIPLPCSGIVTFSPALKKISNRTIRQELQHLSIKYKIYLKLCPSYSFFLSLKNNEIFFFLSQAVPPSFPPFPLPHSPIFIEGPLSARHWSPHGRHSEKEKSLTPL